VFGDGPVHILPYDPKWHELFAILYFLSKIIMHVPEPNQKRGSPVPVHITLYWSAALTKTNRENKIVKYNIVAYTIDSFISYFCSQTIYIETKKLTTITKHLTTIEKSKYLYVVVVDNHTSVKYNHVHHITSTTMKMVGCNVYWHM
jgi:hypothetical protein